MSVNLFRRVKTSMFNALRQGWTPAAVSWSAAWGVTWALFPILGVSMLTLGAIGWVWKLNHPVMQALNHLLGPIKLLFIVPYIRLGEWMYQPEVAFTLSIPEFTLRFKDAPMRTLSEFAMTFAHAASGWLVTVPVLLAVSYLVTRALLRTGEAARAQLREVRS